LPSEVLVEVCVDSVESAIASEQGGAQRIELCSNLPEGGVTPSAGMIAMTRKRVSIALHVLIRPRAGDFTYSDLEFEVIKRDILLAKQLGANGVALGVLASEGNIDVVRTRELVSLARPMAATFHRAFDLTRDPLAALEDVISTNADRVLTSGGAETAEKGSANLARLHKAAKGRIQIMAAGNIREHNVRNVLCQTGVREVHAALHRTVSEDGHTTHKPDLLATAKANDRGRWRVLPETVAAFVSAVAKNASSPSPGN
jgi:copper homeostasis protein